MGVLAAIVLTGMAESAAWAASKGTLRVAVVNFEKS